MAGETISLDYTAPPPGLDERGNGYQSDTLLYPGYQLLHQLDERGNGYYIVRRVKLRTSIRLAQRGIEEEYHTYPTHYATQEEATAAAGKLYAQDGPGDCGDETRDPLAIDVKNAREAAAKAAAAAAPTQPAPAAF